MGSEGTEGGTVKMVQKKSTVNYIFAITWQPADASFGVWFAETPRVSTCACVCWQHCGNNNNKMQTKCLRCSALLLLHVLQLQQEGAPKYAAIKIAQIASPGERERDTERMSVEGEGEKE